MEQVASFEISKTIRQEPFREVPVQNFFSKWCEINDFIRPSYITREQWQERLRQNKGLLEKNQDNSNTLYLPTDLHLWEMAEVIEIIDENTFANKPELRNLKKQEILTLGKMFRNSAIYIAQRIDGIKEGKPIAGKLARDFFSYGNALITGEMSRGENEPEIKNIAKGSLSEEELEKVDKWLAGEDLYRKRLIKVGQKTADSPEAAGDVTEDMRIQTLAQFFRVLERTFKLSNPKKEFIGFKIKNYLKRKINPITRAEKGEQQDAEKNKSEAWVSYQKFLGRDNLLPNEQIEKERLESIIFTLKPWELSTPIHSAFIKKINKELQEKIETPKRELNTAIFSRGVEKLASETKNWRRIADPIVRSLAERRKLADSLCLTELKAELGNIRQSGNADRISAKEREITDKIQDAISGFHFNRLGNSPTEILTNHHINCVGASMLGGALMKEAGLNYLVGDIPSHSILFLVTEDGHVEWRDMLRFKTDLVDEMIEGRKKDGSLLTVADIVAFSRNHKFEKELIFDVNWAKSKYGSKLKQPVVISKPEFGLQIQTLNNEGLHLLFDLGRPEEALELFRQAVALGSKLRYPYLSLGRTLLRLGENEQNSDKKKEYFNQALEAYKQAITVGDKSAIFNNMGIALSDLGRNEEAIETYRQAIVIDPEYKYPYNGLGNVLSTLGRNEEAIEAYKKYIRLADKEEDNYWIRRAKDIITKLQSK